MTGQTGREPGLGSGQWSGHKTPATGFSPLKFSWNDSFEHFGQIAHCFCHCTSKSLNMNFMFISVLKGSWYLALRLRIPHTESLNHCG